MKTLRYQPNLAGRSFQIRQRGRVLDIRLPRMPGAAGRTVLWCLRGVAIMGIPGMILWLIATSAIPSAPTDMIRILALGAVLLLGLLFVTMGVLCLDSGGTLRIGHRWARYAPPDALLPSLGSLVDVLDIERKDPCLAILHVSAAGFLLNPKRHKVHDQYFQLVSPNAAELDAIEAAVAAFNRRQFAPAEFQAARRKRIAGYALLAAGLFAGFLMLYAAAPGRWSHYAQTQNRPLTMGVAATMLALLATGCALLHTAAKVRPIAPKPPSEDLLTRLARWLAEKQGSRHGSADAPPVRKGTRK